MVDEIDVGQGASAPSPALQQLIVEYALARTRREQHEDEGKAIRAREAELEALLFDAMENQGLRSVRHAQYGQFILNDLAWADVIDEAKVRAWADAEMPEILLANRSRLATVVREALKGDRDMPPGVEAKFSRKINWRRG